MRSITGRYTGWPVSTTLLSALQLQSTWTVNYQPTPPPSIPGLQQFGVTSETLLCLSLNLKEFPPSVCQTPNLCKVRLWSMQLHAHVDTLTRKHWFKHTQMLTNGRIWYIKKIPWSYRSLGTGREFSVNAQAVDHWGGQGRQHSHTQWALLQNLMEETQHESPQSFCSSQTHHSQHSACVCVC